MPPRRAAKSAASSASTRSAPSRRPARPARPSRPARPASSRRAKTPAAPAAPVPVDSPVDSPADSPAVPPPAPPPARGRKRPSPKTTSRPKGKASRTAAPNSTDVPNDDSVSHVPRPSSSISAPVARPAAETNSAPPSSRKPPASSTTRARPKMTRPLYDEVWKHVYLAGTEWDQLALVYAHDWDFDHLDYALNDGFLTDKPLYLFGSTEPQLIKTNPNDVKGTVVPVPVIIAVDTTLPPPELIGIKSVQRATEEIVPMSELRMSWESHRPANVAHRRTFQPLVRILACRQRKVRLRHMEEEAVHRYDYVLPYFFNPDKQEEIDADTEVQVLAELEGHQAPVMCEFDYDMDDLDEFLEEQISNNDLDPSVHASPLRKAIQEAVTAAKKKNRDRKEDIKKRIDAISTEDREAMRSMRVFKFYPMSDWPDISDVKSKYVNRYYGHANEIIDHLSDSDED